MPNRPNSCIVIEKPTLFSNSSKGAPPKQAPAVPMSIVMPVTFATCFGSSHIVPSFTVPMKPQADPIPIKNLAVPPIKGWVVLPKIKQARAHKKAAPHKNKRGPKRSIVMPSGIWIDAYDQ